MSDVTKLRYVKSVDPDKLVEYTNKLLAYKIEIKGNPIFVKGSWYLWFNLPDKLLVEFPFGNLDRGKK